MTRKLVALLVLTILLMPAAVLATNTAAQSSSQNYDWAISAYNSNLANHSEYEAYFMNFSYFGIHPSSSFYSIAEILNIPLQVSGCILIDGIPYYSVNYILLQLGVVYLSNGSALLDTNYIVFYSGGLLQIVFRPVMITSSSITKPFDILSLYQGFIQGWIGHFYNETTCLIFPGTPIYAGEEFSLASNVELYIASVSSVSKPIIISSEYVMYPSVSLEVHAPSQYSFTDCCPFFVTLFKLYVNGEPYNAPTNGQNLISADSASAEADYGAEIGESPPPYCVAWGAVQSNITYNVRWWMLGTIYGIIFYPTQPYQIINYVTSPQEPIAKS
ncbi:hypothetical protein [Stygiolobus caldivivus]|uniref:Uncharacterized protein n=1 Tax=Stygiolobus caldivivus TaxID=2824673 RepID=A0A8D5ZHL5_9CREN|nr:hypothetical protein [Stygiolobus caldivivus]BCU69809.1 hypothetical protein KN1_11060 [Stygiolobus caldivivus]